MAAGTESTVSYSPKIQRVHRMLTFVGLGEGAEDGDLVAEDLARRPADAGLVVVHAVHDELAAAAHVVDGVLENAHAAGSFDDDVEAVRVLLLDLLELRLRVLAAERHVGVARAHLLGQVHLEALGRRHHHVAAAVLPQHLRQHQARGARAQQQHARAHLGADAVQPVRRARRRLQQRRLHVRQVVDLEHLAGRVRAVLGEGAGQRHAVRVEVLAQQQVAAAAVEALLAELLHVVVSWLTVVDRDWFGRRTELSATTRSPIWKPLTSLPTAATTPTHSWPGIRGN